ncbi:MAG TPA: RNA polymerase sigma factor [Bacteroidales bacterium]|nr:RNA polymerase sigma factor [Bacteroidales bacterium]HPJ59340.1 RNA polymerase sigma factor [Bacteroidales bacterium]HPR13221.1 RNA polymerase sigma factor [Bacteroidales bacterium]HRW85646.1 RNA polymerase sigma factor [Bacteroidales bacterium]
MTVKEYNKAVDEYADALYRFIRADLRDDARADDIVQDSYEKLWRHVTEIEFPVVKSWLFSTAYHAMIDIIRKEKRMSVVDEINDAGMLSDSQYSDLNEILHAALARLPENLRTAVLLRDYEGYSYREIGEITGLGEAAVKINIYRGRMALKNYIGKIETVI